MCVAGILVTAILKGFVSHDHIGWVGSSVMYSGPLAPDIAIFSHIRDYLTSLNLLMQLESASTLASCTLPGHAS